MAGQNAEKLMAEILDENADILTSAKRLENACKAIKSDQILMKFSPARSLIALPGTFGAPPRTFGAPPGTFGAPPGTLRRTPGQPLAHLCHRFS